jgi:undecaprenyl-diphosphatase
MNNLIIEFLASFLIWFMFAGLLLLWFIDGRITKEQVLHALIAAFIAWLIANILQNIIPTTRPFVTNGGPTLVWLPKSPDEGSFPSGHTALAFGLATTIWLHERKIGWVYLVLALIVGAARVLANVHYPIDILGGALLGMFTAFAVEKAHVFKLLSRLKTKL